jgi:hypothetical protein
VRTVWALPANCLRHLGEPRTVTTQNSHFYYGLSVGGLPLPKVLKNTTNHMFSVRHRLSQEASALGESIRNVKEQPEGERNK